MAGIQLTLMESYTAGVDQRARANVTVIDALDNRHQNHHTLWSSHRRGGRIFFASAFATIVAWARATAAAILAPTIQLLKTTNHAAIIALVDTAAACRSSGDGEQRVGTGMVAMELTILMMGWSRTRSVGSCVMAEPRPADATTIAP